MTARAPARRGRPKGTGIDDNDLLDRIKAVLSADPALRPTAAIRAAGVSDPSAIRRLRDKLASGPQMPPAAKAAPTEKPVSPLKARSGAAIKSAPPRGAQPRAESVKARAMGRSDRPDAQVLASYLAAVGDAPAATTGGEKIGTAPHRAPAAPERPVPSIEPTGATRSAAPAAAPSPQSANAANVPSPFEMMARLSAPMAHTPQAMLEGVRLAVEAATSISRLQVFLMQGSLRGTPLAMMLQGQSAMAQMMLTALAGVLARPPTKT